MRALGPALLCAACAATIAPDAHADAGPKIDPGWYLPIGVTNGLAIHPDAPDGYFLGFEASIVHLDVDSLHWIGLYADALRDFASDANRFSIGPEIGAGPLGLDVGYLYEDGDDQNRHGVVIRPMLTLGLIALTGRFGRLAGDHPESFGELGVLLKFPIPIAVDHRPPWIRRQGPMPSQEPAPVPDQAPPPPPPPPVEEPFAQPPPS